MKNSWFSKIMMLAISIVPLLSLNSPVEAQTKRNIYSCINHQGKPSTVVDTEKGRILLIVWESDFFRGSGWTPQKRCEEVSVRFQNFSDNKQLRYLTTGKINKQNVICVGKEIGHGNYDCLNDGLLITLEARDDSNQVLQDLFKATRSGSDFLRRRNKYVLDMDLFIEHAEVMAESSTSQTSPPPISEPPKENPDCPPLFCD